MASHCSARYSSPEETQESSDAPFGLRTSSSSCVWDTILERAPANPVVILKINAFMSINILVELSLPCRWGMHAIPGTLCRLRNGANMIQINNQPYWSTWIPMYVIWISDMPSSTCILLEKIRFHLPGFRSTKCAKRSILVVGFGFVRPSMKLWCPSIGKTFPCLCVYAGKEVMKKTLKRSKDERWRKWCFIDSGLFRSFKPTMRSIHYSTLTASCTARCCIIIVVLLKGDPTVGGGSFILCCTTVLYLLSVLFLVPS